MTLSIDPMEKIPRLVAKLPADPLSLWERAGVRVPASPEWERAGVRVSATPEWERPGEGACISAKLESSAFHHSYFTLHSSTGGLGYGL